TSPPGAWLCWSASRTRRTTPAGPRPSRNGGLHSLVDVSSTDGCLGRRKTRQVHHGNAAGFASWTSTSDDTRILAAIEQGEPCAAEQLLPLVYDELRKLAAERMAQEKPGQTLQATALVHEAYLRLVDVKQAQHCNSRGHFFAAAAEAMRRILVERARRKKRSRHGGDWQRV